MAYLNHEFDLVKAFGTFPELYHGFAHVSTERSADLVHSRRLLVGYDLTPDVQVYDVGGGKYDLIKTLDLQHPAFKHPEEEITMELAGNRDDLYARMARISRVHRTYGFENGYQFPEGVQSLGAHAFHVVEEGYIHAVTKSDFVLDFQRLLSSQRSGSAVQ